MGQKVVYCLTMDFTARNYEVITLGIEALFVSHLVLVLLRQATQSAAAPEIVVTKSTKLKSTIVRQAVNSFAPAPAERDDRLVAIPSRSKPAPKLAQR